MKPKFMDVYGRFHKPLLSFIKKKISNESHAEELLQEVFVKIHLNLDNYNPTYTLSTWVFTIARNTCFDVLRSSRVKKEDLGIEGEYIDKLAGEGNPEQLLSRFHDEVQAKAALAPLTDLQRRAVALRFFGQLSFKEVAAQMNITVTAAKNLVQRAKIQLSQNSQLQLV